MLLDMFYELDWRFGKRYLRCYLPLIVFFLYGRMQVCGDRSGSMGLAHVKDRRNSAMEHKQSAFVEIDSFHLESLVAHLDHEATLDAMRVLKRGCALWGDALKR